MTTQGPILVRTVAGGTWTSPATTSYTNEAHLQSILVADPGQIPGVSDDALGVAELETGAGPADVCVVDSDGSLTVVECKLASNSERRRMVIGQVLDYASAIHRRGPDAFLAAWRDHAGEDLSDRLSPEAIAALGERIETARIHLCLAVDAIDDDLRRLVEFLNNATATEVRVTALQLEYASHDGIEILIPRTFGGEIADAKQAGTSTSTPWTWDTFVEAIGPEPDRQLAEEIHRRLHSLDERHGDHSLLWFGTAPGGGIFLHPFGVRFAPMQLWVNSAGRLMVYGNWSVYRATRGHEAFAGLARLLGQDHTKGYRGVKAEAVDLDEIWAEALRVALAINCVGEDRGS